MPYSVISKKSGVEYFLHSSESKTLAGRRLLYYFARQIKTGGEAVVLDALPEGYMVTESQQTGLPLLKRIV